jgi:hypothetical protein
VAVVIAFFVCYAPLYLQRLLSAIMGLNTNLNPDSHLFSNIMAYLYIISGTTFYFGSVINPILYNVVSNKYRRAFRDLFCCRLTFKIKPNIQKQRKLFQTKRLSNQPIHYFIKKTLPPPSSPSPQQQQQQQENDINQNLSLNSDQLKRKNDNQTIAVPMIKYPTLSNPQSSRSNSSSISSHNREYYQTRSFHSNASLPKKCQAEKRTKSSLRRKLFGQKQPTDTVPWLVTKNKT